MFEGRYRDGTAEYYVSENKVSDDLKWGGPWMRLASLSPTLVDKFKSKELSEQKAV